MVRGSGLKGAAKEEEQVIDVLLSALDGTQRGLWRLGVRFQWPCWLLGWAWDYRAPEGLPGQP